MDPEFSKRKDPNSISVLKISTISWVFSFMTQKKNLSTDFAWDCVTRQIDGFPKIKDFQVTPSWKTLENPGSPDDFQSIKITKPPSGDILFEGQFLED